MLETNVGASKLLPSAPRKRKTQRGNTVNRHLKSSSCFIISVPLSVLVAEPEALDCKLFSSQLWKYRIKLLFTISALLGVAKMLHSALTLCVCKVSGKRGLWVGFCQPKPNGPQSGGVGGTIKINY